MGDLPKERLSISWPFAYVLVDFDCPFSICCINHRSFKDTKYYEALFVYPTTRAVDIESVYDLSTNTFIASLQRFSSRRGILNTIWSYNAINFVGAKNWLDSYCQSKISEEICFRSISTPSWHILKAAVKSGKKYLVAASEGSVLNSEEFNTIFAQELILYPRSLCRKRDTSGPVVIDVITPGHFLVSCHLLHAAAPEISTLIHSRTI